MSGIYSNADDCYSLAVKLKKHLGDKISFYGTVYTPTPSGYYLSSYRKNKHETFFLNDNCLPFYYKFAENGFLRIQVGSNIIGTDSLGEKLAALSDFYAALSEEYGEPTVFYTTKDDDKDLLSLQWSFANRDEDIAKLKNGTYFDDDEVDTLIVFGEKRENAEGFDLSDTTKRLISRKVGLPLELLYLADQDIENFIKHKEGKEMTIPEGTKADGKPALSSGKKLEKKIGAKENPV